MKSPSKSISCVFFSYICQVFFKLLETEIKKQTVMHLSSRHHWVFNVLLFCFIFLCVWSHIDCLIPCSHNFSSLSLLFTISPSLRSSAPTYLVLQALYLLNLHWGWKSTYPISVQHQPPSLSSGWLSCRGVNCPSFNLSDGRCLFTSWA